MNWISSCALVVAVLATACGPGAAMRDGGEAGTNSLSGPVTCPDGTTCADGRYCVNASCSGTDAGIPDGGPRDAGSPWSCQAPRGGCTIAAVDTGGGDYPMGSCVFAFCAQHVARLSSGGRTIECMCK